jgi:muramoyltetrapeptide carboxypeptidase
MTQKYWNKINQGDKACIIAPSYGLFINDNLAINIAKAESIVESYGLTAFTYFNAIAPNNHTLYNDNYLRLANSDEIRASHLIDALNNPDCAIVWAYRGGYGAIRLLNALNQTTQPQQVKPFIGFSDATIIHSYLNDVWKWA